MTVHTISMLSHANTSLLKYSSIVHIRPVPTLLFALKKQTARLKCCLYILLHEFILSTLLDKSHNLSDPVVLSKGDIQPSEKVSLPPGLKGVTAML
ncbi:hypothetical protein DM15PD_14260 [Aristophania vespae]|nr:hypothetical protein DM15PD_14260 [Aristophania vespae]